MTGLERWLDLAEISLGFKLVQELTMFVIAFPLSCRRAGAQVLLFNIKIYLSNNNHE